MVRLLLAGADTALLSSLCASCPQGVAGCCASPPRIDWADLGRIVQNGGRDWVLSEIETGNLLPASFGLCIRRAAGPPLKCVYHGTTGCTIAPGLRSATCNYYVCEDAVAESAGADQHRIRAMHERIVAAYIAWNNELEIAIADTFKEGVPWNAAFLDWLGARFQLASAHFDPGSHHLRRA